MNKFVFCFLFLPIQFYGQQSITDIDTLAVDRKLEFKYKQLIIPAVFIGYGIIGLESGQIKGFNSGLSAEVTENIDEKTSIDDFSQYAPIAGLYGLSAMGVKGKR